MLTFYISQRFIALSRVSHWTLYWSRWIHSNFHSLLVYEPR